MLLRKEGERIERQTSSQLCLERKLQNYPELFRAFMQFPTSLTATDVATSCQIALTLPAQSLYIDHKNNPRRESRFFFQFQSITSLRANCSNASLLLNMRAKLKYGCVQLLNIF